MLFEQLVRLIIALVELFVGLVLLLVVLFGLVLMTTSPGWLGFSVVAGVVWFVVAARRNRRARN